MYTLHITHDGDSLVAARVGDRDFAPVSIPGDPITPATNSRDVAIRVADALGLPLPADLDHDGDTILAYWD